MQSVIPNENVETTKSILKAKEIGFKSSNSHSKWRIDMFKQFFTITYAKCQ